MGTVKLRNTRIALISCSKKKSKEPGEISAWKRYWPSTLFSLSYEYARAVWKADQIFILSAKYGIIPHTAIIPDYEMSLNSLSATERLRWAVKVNKGLAAISPNKQRTFLILAGTMYSKQLDLAESFSNGVIETPLTGLGMGKRMQKLRQMIDENRFDV